MEYMLESLSARCKRSPPLTQPEICSIMSDVARALVYMHSLNVIHRDLSPTNILLSVVNDCVVAKITDYHSAKVTLEGGLRELSGNPLRQGQLKYFAPETHDQSCYDEKVDIYAFGVILLELLLLPESVSPLSTCRSEEAARLAVKLGQDHPLFFLVTECIRQDSSRRPSASDVTTKLKEIQSRPEFQAPKQKPCTQHRDIAVMTDAANTTPSSCFNCQRLSASLSVSP